MNPHQIKRLFPFASASVLAANVSDYGSGDATNPPNRPIPEPRSPAGAFSGMEPTIGAPTPVADKPRKVCKRRKAMNQTETAFAQILEARMKAGEIVSFEYEGMTLRWGKLDNIQYSPDFVVFESIHSEGHAYPAVEIVFIEAKGAHIWPKDMQKFKQARNEWPLFRFEMWQRKKGQWAQLY